jgi:hypothetical protein
MESRAIDTLENFRLLLAEAIEAEICISFFCIFLNYFKGGFNITFSPRESLAFNSVKARAKKNETIFLCNSGILSNAPTENISK